MATLPNLLQSNTSPSSGVNTTNPFSTPSPTANVSGIKVAPAASTQNSGLIKIGGGTQSTAPIMTSPIGVKATSPANNVKPPVTTLPKSQVNTTPAPTVQASTEGGTQQTGQATPQYGSTYYDPATGHADGTNLYDPNTGLPLTNPAAGATNSSNTANVTGQPTPTNNGLYGTLINELQQSTGNNQQLGQNAQNIASNEQQQIQGIGTQAANLEGNQGSMGLLPSALGAQQIISNTASNAQQAVAQGANAALTGNAQALTGQAQTQSGLGTAITAAAPSQAAYGQTVFDPVTGQYTDGGGLPAGVMQQYASLAANGQLAAVPSFITSNPVLNAQLNAAAAAINPSYSPIASTAQGAATSSNIQTGGTSNTQTAASGYASTLPAYQSASTAFSTADKQATNLLNTLSQTGINSSNSTDYNATINSLASKLGSTKTQAFSTSLAEAQQAYTNLLASVGAATPTVNGQQATAILNPSSTPAQIAESIDKLNQAAYAKLEPQYQQALTYYNQLHGTNVTAIPGYPAPTLPATVSANAPQGPDTSAGNLDQEAIGATVQGVDGIIEKGASLLFNLLLG